MLHSCSRLRSINTSLNTEDSIGGLLRKYSLSSHYRNTSLNNRHPRFSSLVSYSVMTPFVTILHAALDLILFSHNSLPPTHALTVSIITLCTWGLQVAFWTQCDLRHNFAVTGTTCYQSNLDESMTGVSQGAGRARVAVGFSVIFLCV